MSVTAKSENVVPTSDMPLAGEKSIGSYFSSAVAETIFDMRLKQPAERKTQKREELPLPDDGGVRQRVMEDLEETFKLFDIDGDGKISLQELMSAMTSVGKEVSVEDAQEILEILDEDGDGEINFEEFKNMMYDKLAEGTVEEDLEETFQTFDQDQDGFISPLEIQSLFRKLGEMISLEEALEIMADCDINEDGLIDFNEFKLYYKKMNLDHVKMKHSTVTAPAAEPVVNQFEF